MLIAEIDRLRAENAQLYCALKVAQMWMPIPKPEMPQQADLEKAHQFISAALEQSARTS